MSCVFLIWLSACVLSCLCHLIAKADLRLNVYVLLCGKIPFKVYSPKLFKVIHAINGIVLTHGSLQLSLGFLAKHSTFCT